ncbi:hypothetical protein CUMW_037190 [Citrus unshiu]|nr:hypothetical protein CUMW_037190 [Citrus unshiu]
MEEMSPAVSLTLSFSNSMTDNSGHANHVEITRLKFVTDRANLLSDSNKLASEESSPGAKGNISNNNNEVNRVILSAAEGNGGQGVGLLKIFPESGSSIISSDAVILENEDDEILSVIEDPNGIINEGLVVLDPGKSLTNSVEIDSGRILAKAIILGESSVEQVPTAEVLITPGSLDAKTCDRSDFKASAVVIQLPAEKNITREVSRSVFEVDCIPLWGSVSIRGRRPEMEDAVAIVPRFMKIPIRMLIGDRVIDGMSHCLNGLTSHFFGVYDGHGGSQIFFVLDGSKIFTATIIWRGLMQAANYCRERIHLALAEEIGIIKNDLTDESTKVTRQGQWEKTFTSCFLKVDDEIGGKAGRSVNAGDGDASEVIFEAVAPETVGSTAVVALVCSSHIIVANCGDRYLKPWIIPEPEVVFIPRARDDECLILASDGLWDVMTNEEACEVARKRILLWHKKHGAPPLVERGKEIDPAAQAAAEYLSMLALQKGSKDNISVIVVDLKAQRKFKSKS